jgi:nucleoside-diphosphate-sugar epimerase
MRVSEEQSAESRQVESRPSIRGKRAAVTGASGFLGRYLVAALLERGADVVAVVRNPERFTYFSPEQVDLRVANLGDPEALEKALQGVEIVIANAALLTISPKGWDPYLATNVDGTINLFDAMHGAGVKRCVQVSSTGIYRGSYPPIEEDHPKWGEGHRIHRLNGYQVSKALAEQTAWRYAEEYGISMTALRPTGIYGAFDHNFSKWHKRATRLRPFAIYPYWMGICLVYAGDVAEAAMLSLERPAAEGRAYNVTGEDRSLWEFQKVWRRLDPRCKGPCLPVPVPVHHCYNNDRIRQELGWEPRSYEDGIRETLALEEQAAAEESQAQGRA